MLSFEFQLLVCLCFEINAEKFCIKQIIKKDRASKKDASHTNIGLKGMLEGKIISEYKSCFGFEERLLNSVSGPNCMVL